MRLTIIGDNIMELVPTPVSRDRIKELLLSGIRDDDELREVKTIHGKKVLIYGSCIDVEYFIVEDAIYPITRMGLTTDVPVLYQDTYICGPGDVDKVTRDSVDRMLMDMSSSCISLVTPERTVLGVPREGTKYLYPDLWRICNRYVDMSNVLRQDRYVYNTYEIGHDRVDEILDPEAIYYIDITGVTGGYVYTKAYNDSKYRVKGITPRVLYKSINTIYDEIKKLSI